MKLKPGYKQTEVGVIPKDWNIVEIDEISKTSSGTTPARSQGERYFKNGEFHWIKTMDLNNSLIEDTEEKVTALALKETCLQMYPIGTVLVAMYGGFNQIGRTGLLGIAASVNQALAAIQLERKKVEPRFLLNTLNYRVEYWKSVASSSRKDPNITSNDVKHFKFPLPPTTAEQTAIANALSDTDALIQSLTRLIAKKRQIKQGAMQTLLNPYENGRLKEGWEIKKMPEVCWFQEGPGVRNSQFTKSGVKLLNGTNIDQGELFLDKTDRYISEKEAYGWYSHFLADEGDILIACSGITVEKFHEKVTVLRKEHLPLCMNTSTMRFKVTSKELLHNYLIHFLRSRVFKEQIGGKATGSAQLNFGPSHVNAVEIALPPINEQTRIATILSNMDDEIATLEAKLAKYRHIKQGMMQNLLTGRIRLVKPENNTGAVA